MAVNETHGITNVDLHKKKLVDPGYNPEQAKFQLSDIRHTGFYYDSQLLDPSMTMTLHPSTYNDGGTWKPFTNGFPPFFSGEEGITYSKTPIAVCLLSEDPTFSVSNRFTDFNGGNPIEDIFNSLKPYAPLAGKIAEGLSNSNLKEDYGSSWVNFINSAAEKVGDWAKKSESVLNKALFIQGTRFTYYNGSDFSTSQMEMKFTKFSEYDTKGNFINVATYIEDTLSPYCFGRYRKLSDTGADDKPFGGGWVGNIKEQIAEYVGVQSPPGGFKMCAKSLNNALFGTLRLNIGGVYAIENLLIKGMTFTFSKSQAKDPVNPGKTVPLYADISLTLCPASMMTDNAMEKTLAGAGLEGIMSAKANENIAMLEKMKEDRISAFSSVNIKKY
jgi:hypothetical protein